MNSRPPVDARAALDSRLRELEGATSSTVAAWRNETLGVIRGIFGAEHPSIRELQQISFWPLSSLDGGERRAYLDGGKRQAQGVLRGALDELELSAKAMPSQALPQGPEDPSVVFVVHGRNTRLLGDVFSFLRAIGLTPMLWSRAVSLADSGTPYVGEILDAAFANAQAIVVLMTPDDEARLRPVWQSKTDPPEELDLTPQPRPNVLLEAGMAFGRSPQRTILVEVGPLRGLSDLGGRFTVRLSNDTIRRQEFAQRLRDAGCPLDLDSSTEWHTVGRLELLEGE